MRLALDRAVTDGWLRAYAEPQRHYHTRDHIERMFADLDEADASRELIAAIWLHDIVYDPRASDNEERSAERAIVDLGESGIDARLVAELVVGTKHHGPGSAAQNLLNDIDLGIFAANEPDYDRYAGDIRKEYAWVAEEDYRRGRLKVLESFDARQIYQSPKYAAWEERAHANIRREMAKLAA